MLVAVVGPGPLERRKGRHGPGETHRPGLRTGHGGALGVKSGIPKSSWEFNIVHYIRDFTILK